MLPDHPVNMEPANLLHRLGAARPLAAYGGRLRLRYAITPRYR